MVTYLFFDTNVHDTRFGSQPTHHHTGRAWPQAGGMGGEELEGSAICLSSLPRLQPRCYVPSHHRCRCWPLRGYRKGLPSELGTPGSQPQAQVLSSLPQPALSLSAREGKKRWREWFLSSQRTGTEEGRQQAGPQLLAPVVPGPRKGEMVLLLWTLTSHKARDEPGLQNGTAVPHTHTQARRDTQLPQC